MRSSFHISYQRSRKRSISAHQQRIGLVLRIKRKKICFALQPRAITVIVSTLQIIQARFTIIAIPPISIWIHICYSAGIARHISSPAHRLCWSALTMRIGIVRHSAASLVYQADIIPLDVVVVEVFFVVKLHGDQLVVLMVPTVDKITF